MEMLRTAPTYREVAGQIEAALTGKTLLIYNADFDVRLWKQTAKFAGVPAAKHEVHVS